MKISILALVAGVFGVTFPLAADAATLYVECESFAELGGWVVDPHSMKALGSSYVMAHGIGKPVVDARTTVAVPSAGRYAVWAKTRDWSSEWREGRGSAPGRFRVVVNGVELGAELGDEGRDWHWQKAGEVDLASGAADVALRDITGFNGRCDALVFTDDLAAKPPFARPEAKVADNPATYDLAVVGGGMAGICMAQTAVRYGLKVLLLQDREVLGGCNSSEVRVGLGGAWHLPPYPNLGKVVDDLAPAFNNNRPLPPEFYEDARKANFFVRTKRNCAVLYREHVFAVETDPANPKRIVAVLSRNTHTGAVTRHRASLFADATGDATIARLAGCETMYGREERGRFNESCAPEKASRQVMGHSTQWTSRVADAPVPFPDIDWGFVLDESNAYHITEGGWEQEAGQYRDMADDTEAIRDYGLYAVFSNWSYLKNRSSRKAEWTKREITWISPIGGKRESYRVVGDLVLTQNDIENHVKHPDLSAPMYWNIDLHFPDPDNEAKFKEPFRSCAYHRCYNGPYAIPYRCLYARDCDNLFLAGRDISCSHVAFAATRVMGTLGVCGEVAGMAAAVCRKNACMPRDVYEKHLGKLKAMMEKGAPSLGFYHSGGCAGELEFYHFKSDDKHERPQIYPKPSQLTPEQERKIRAIGIQHRHEHPQFKQLRLECDVAVVGGGSAGFAAAWSAAKCGADVVLVEREDELGGTSTVGGVSSWEPVCGARGLPELVYGRLKKEGQAGVYRIAHHCSWPEKDGSPKFPGALLEIDNDAPYSVTLRRHGPGMKDEKWFRENCRGVIFDPDAMSRTMRDMLDETGRCRVMTGTTFVSAEHDGGRIARLHLSDGMVVEPKVVVDACGAVAKSVGCELMFSERPNGASLIYRVERSGGTAAPSEPPPRCWWRENYPSAFCMALPNGEVAVNMLPTMSGEEVARLGETAAYEEARKRVEAHWRWMQKEWPAFAGWKICRIAKRLALRETFRVRGDYVLTGDDVRRGVRPPDEIASADHALDAHGGEGFGGELKAPYGIPYRCLIAAGMDNLLVAGRIASFDSVAATSCRLSRTMMKLGEAAGAAAAMAAQSGRSVRAVGAAEKSRRFVLADESRPRLHYYDSSDEAKCFSIPGERPMWDLKRVGRMRYRAVVKNGFLVFDINERRVVDSFRHPALDIVTAVCDLPDGGFVASVNPQKAPDKNKVVLLVRFSKDREMVATYRCEGFFYARSLEWDRDGETLLLSWEKGFARIRLPAEGTTCEIVSDFRQPKGRNLFDVVPSRFGGYLAGCGYGGGLVHFGDDGKVASVWFLPEKDGKKSLFYAQPKEMPDGRIYMAHWTGHGAEDSRKGWQVVEFDCEGNVVWHLDDPDRFGSISGIDVLP